MSSVNAEVVEKKSLGFWIYLMTDIVLFASLFATYAVLRSGTAGGPDGKDLFEMPFVLGETIILLVSSFTMGMALLFAQRGFRKAALTAMLVTFGLGVAFLVMEVSEFVKFTAEGAGWDRSAFLSAFFTLVATHGLHITVGLIWMLVMMFRYVQRKGAESDVARIGLLSLFWHFLDIIWIFIFTFVYLVGHMGI